MLHTMKSLMILGCNDITKRLLLEICRDRTFATNVCLASRRKQECDELKKMAESRGMRVTTSGIDVSNVEGAMLMMKIIAPELVVNLLPPELAPGAMDLAAKAGADYLDGKLSGVPDTPSATSLLSEQFKKFGQFQTAGKTAVCGAGVMPGVVTTIARKFAAQDFDKVKKIDIVRITGDVEKKSKDGKEVAVDETLYAEDIKAALAGDDAKKQDGKEKETATEKVFIVEGGKLKALDAASLKAKSASGTDVVLASSPVVTDFLKEIPEVSDIRYFEPGQASEVKTVHKAPAEKIELLKSLGLLSDKPVKVGDVSVAPVDLVMEVLPKMNAGRRAEDKKEAPAKGKFVLEIYITGEKNKKELTRLYKIELDNEECMLKHNVDAEEYLEGTATIAAVKLMCNDKWKKKGVFSPASFDSRIFYEALEAEGIEVKESDSKPLL